MAKFIGLSKITSGISNVVDKVKDHLNSEDEQPQDNVPTVVDSMAEMEQLIFQLRTGAPINVGMVVDNMIIPAEERVAAYVSDLCRIAEKYAISL